MRPAATRARIELIAFYASYRALVRAKVALLSAAQHRAGSSAHGHERADACELLRLAEQFAWRARLPLAIVICGVPAAGKSQLAGALAELARLPHLSSDVTRKRLAGIHPRQRAADAAYGAEFNRLTYSELGRRARSATAAHGCVIVDATFRHRADRQAFAEAFGDAAPVLFVECHAPARVLAERVAQRQRQPARISDAFRSVVLRESSAWDPLESCRRRHTSRFAATAPPRRSLRISEHCSIGGWAGSQHRGSRRCPKALQAR